MAMSRRFTQHPHKLWPVFLLILGILLLTGGSGYFIYSWKAHSNLDSLSVPDSRDDSSTRLYYQRQTPTLTPLAGTPIEDATAQMSPTGIASQVLYPGEVINPILWVDSLPSNTMLDVANPILQEFSPVYSTSLSMPGSLPPPTSLSIPAIGVESEVRGLRILNMGDSRAYETPDNVVGHIPETANAGELGTAWFFGHLESPIRGEGAVFRDLPKIPPLLRQGIDIYVTAENGTSTFLYKLTSSKVVHENDLVIHSVGGASIVLVTCIPRFDYDYRLVITGELIGIKG